MSFWNHLQTFCLQTEGRTSARLRNLCKETVEKSQLILDRKTIVRGTERGTRGQEDKMCLKTTEEDWDGGDDGKSLAQSACYCCLLTFSLETSWGFSSSSSSFSKLSTSSEKRFVVSDVLALNYGEMWFSQVSSLTFIYQFELKVIQICCLLWSLCPWTDIS